jgi:hypothetical protein
MAGSWVMLAVMLADALEVMTLTATEGTKFIFLLV